MNESPENLPSGNLFEKEGRAAAEAARKLKRRIIIGIVILVAFVAVAIPLISLLDKAETEPDSMSAQKPAKPSSVIFYTPDYDRKVDIRKDPSYLELNRAVRLKRDQYTVVITENDLNSQSPAVGVLWNLINAVIDGDAGAYNALFSQRYYTEEGVEPEDPFTMQRVYDIVIEEIREQTVSDSVDGKYNEYVYALEYKINRNDGTYRTDIGHDASRTQYFLLTDREGEVKIDRLLYLVN